MDHDLIDYSTPPDSFVSKIDVHTLLPQQEPFVMIGELSHFDMTAVSTHTRVSADNIFVANGVMNASGIIENIAQTCAARIGYINRYILKKGIQIGFIGAIRNLEIHGNPAVDDTIDTTVQVCEEVFGMILANAEVRCKGKIIAVCEMKIAIKE